MGASKLKVYAKTIYNVDLTPSEADVFRARYFDAYKGLAAWHSQVFAESYRKLGLSRTPSGRLRYLDPELYSEFANTPVQGCEADGLKVSLRNIYFALKKFGTRKDPVRRARLVHHAHDETISEAKQDPDVLEEVKLLVSDAMIRGMSKFIPTVPVGAESSSGHTWADKS
jgi:DNA polymerase-1